MNDELVRALKAADASALGGRIRAARLKAGLTQAQLVGQDASVPFLSRIEAGSRRPDLGLLELFAARLGTTADALIFDRDHDEAASLRLELDYAELALATGDPAAALTSAERVLDRVKDAPRRHRDLIRAARLVAAGGHEATGQVETAISQLEELLEQTTAPDLLWIRAAIALSRCYREAGDIARAVSSGERAAAALAESGLSDSTESIQLTLTLAGAYYTAGDLAHAIRLSERAISRADRIGSSVALASAYWNASLFQSARGMSAGALDLAKRALVLFAAHGDARNLARLRSQVGAMHLEVDPPNLTEAEEHLKQAALEMASSSASATDVARNDLGLAKLALALGDEQGADRQAQQVADSMTQLSPLLAASARALQGRAAIAMQHLDEAQRHFVEAVRLLSASGADRGAAQLWFELGELLGQCGDLSGSRDAFMRAGASTGLSLSRGLGVRVDGHTS